MKVITRMLSDEVYEAVNENGNKVSIDMRKMEERKSQSPTELLLSALAGCGAVDIVLMLKKRKKTIESFIIETDGTRREETPKFFTHIHCKYIVTSADVSEDELQKVSALSLEKYCSVAASLKSEITFSVQVIRP
jgi:putative redox protein